MLTMHFYDYTFKIFPGSFVFHLFVESIYCEIIYYAVYLQIYFAVMKFPSKISGKNPSFINLQLEPFIGMCFVMLGKGPIRNEANHLIVYDVFLSAKTMFLKCEEVCKHLLNPY